MWCVRTGRTDIFCSSIFLCFAETRKSTFAAHVLFTCGTQATKNVIRQTFNRYGCLAKKRWFGVGCSGELMVRLIISLTYPNAKFTLTKKTCPPYYADLCQDVDRQDGHT